jgi:hypothetical protein
VLIDGGADPATLLARLGAQMPFWDRSLDRVILTHPDDDHLTGLVPVVERYRVGQVFDVRHTSLAPAYVRWQELPVEKAIPVLDSRAGTEVGRPGYGRRIDLAAAGSCLGLGDVALSSLHHRDGETDCHHALCFRQPGTGERRAWWEGLTRHLPAKVWVGSWSSF